MAAVERALARPEQSVHLAARVLLAFVLALLTLHAGQPAHLHKGTAPGVYNEEHVLASLESAVGDAPLPDPAPSIWLAVAAHPTVPTAGGPVSSTVARHADSRAPPLT